MEELEKNKGVRKREIINLNKEETQEKIWRRICIDLKKSLSGKNKEKNQNMKENNQRKIEKYMKEIRSQKKV